MKEAEAICGDPTEKAVMSSGTVYAYPDKVLTFRNGKLYKVEFR